MGKTLKEYQGFCCLEVTLDEHLFWNGHTEFICNKVSKPQRLGLLPRIRPYLTLKAAKYVYNCLVQPILIVRTRYGLGCQSAAVKTYSVCRT